MAFPIVQATNGTNSLISDTSFTVQLPAGIIANDLLIGLLSGGNPRTINTPSGWTELFDTSGTEAQLKVVYKVAAGSEGATVTVTT